MQFIPAIAVYSPMIDLIPTAFMILIGMSKEAYLEYRRWKDDKLLNQKPCKILTNVKEGDMDIGEQHDLMFEDS